MYIRKKISIADIESQSQSTKIMNNLNKRLR